MSKATNIQYQTTMPSPTNQTDDPAAFARPHRQTPVSELPFAGRIGGNQEFTVSEDSEKGREILKSQPDAVRSLAIHKPPTSFPPLHL